MFSIVKRQPNLGNQQTGFKVIGLGLSRTGTTSLNAALGKLGYRSQHYYPAIANDYYNFDKVRAFDGLTDFPGPLLYRELDYEFPNTKFILTTRIEQDWIRSMETHFRIGHSKFGWGPWEKMVHEKGYGLKDGFVFERETLLQAFRNHHREVQDYFRDRPDKLLVLDITNGNPWPALCEFLNVQAPESSFPWKNASPTG